MSEKRQLTTSQFEAELKELLKKKIAADPRFSMRQQAARWGVQQSTLHKIVIGQRRLGFHVAQQLASALDVEVIREAKSRERTQTVFNSFEPDSEVQTSWVNMAILEMLNLKDFVPSAAWVAKRLGLEEVDVATRLDQMEKSGMIRREPNGPWSDIFGDAAQGTDHQITSAQIRKSIRALVSASAEAVDEVPLERRVHGFDLFSISEKQLPALRKKIAKWRLEFAQAAQKSAFEKDDVYSLQIGLFPVTHQTIFQESDS